MVEEYDNIDDLMPPTKKESKLSPLEQKVASWFAIAMMIAATIFIVGLVFFGLIWIGRWAISG